jgi:hypothetical protein
MKTLTFAWRTIPDLVNILNGHLLRKKKNHSSEQDIVFRSNLSSRVRVLINEMYAYGISFIQTLKAMV